MMVDTLYANAVLRATNHLKSRSYVVTYFTSLTRCRLPLMVVELAQGGEDGCA